MLQAQQGAGVDLVGVRLSDLVRLYFERLDGRNYVACGELVQDTRLVSLRAGEETSRAAIEGLLRVHGYGLTDRGGVTYVCPIAQPVSAPAARGASTLLDEGTPIVAAAGDHVVSAAPATSYQSFAGGGSSTVDRLAELGFEPAGCVDVGGVIKVAMRSPREGRTQMVELAQVKRSKIAPLIVCRL